MAKIMNGNRVVTNEVRLSYANVWKPKSINGSDEKYSVSLIIPKSDTETISLINKAIDQAITDGISKFGGKKPNKGALKLPLRDGDVEKDDEAYATPKQHLRLLVWIECLSQMRQKSIAAAMRRYLLISMRLIQMEIKVSHVDLVTFRRSETVRA